VLIPIAAAVLAIRRAISPRFAMRRDLIGLMDDVSFEADGWVEMGDESWRCRGGGGRCEREGRMALDTRGVLRRCDVRLRERILGDWSTTQLFRARIRKDEE